MTAFLNIDINERFNKIDVIDVAEPAKDILGIIYMSCYSINIPLYLFNLFVTRVSLDNTLIPLFAESP